MDTQDTRIAGLRYRKGECTILLLNVYLPKASGVSVALAAGSRKDDGNYYYGKLGYDKDIWALGTTSFAVDYYNGSDFVSDGSDTDIWGIGLNQNIDRYNAQLYVGYRRSSFDEKGQSYQDIDSYIIGGLWSF